jgi:hypothetical protein
MTSDGVSFNLTAFSDRLFAEGRLLSLAGKIKLARELHSLHADLAMAIESLDVLVATPIKSEDFRTVVTEFALLNNAIILYARATKVKSDERGGYDLRSRFTDQEKLAHKELIDLRDKAIAHFGSGGTYSGEWQAELVVLQTKGTATKPGIITRRQMIDRKLLERVRKQVCAAYNMMGFLSVEMLEKITEELNNVAANDPNFLEELRQHPLNLSLFMTSADAVESALSQFEGGYVRGIVRHG